MNLITLQDNYIFTCFIFCSSIFIFATASILSVVDETVGLLPSNELSFLIATGDEKGLSDDMAAVARVAKESKQKRDRSNQLKHYSRDKNSINS